MRLAMRQFGNIGTEVSVLGVGGWLGLLDDPQAPSAQKEAEAIQAVRRAVTLGVNYFDTAPGYGGGEAERHLGLGLKALAREERARLMISTKVGTHPQRPHRYDADSTLWSVDQSVRVLFSDVVNIVYIHDPLTDAQMNNIMGKGGAVEALERLKEQGVIHAIGLGVRNHRFLRRAIESGRFDAILTPYDYTPIRASARAVIELAAERGLGVVNGSPYDAGLLAGLHPDVASGRRTAPSEADLERARALWSWCEARQVDIGALAMQFSLRNPHISATLAGPRTAKEVEVNVQHARAILPDGIFDELDAFLKTLGPEPPGGEVE
ncbi:aldo/keto reductase [Candidatus Poribacteria bacterium]|nr:aldo/keto reductase [Candidatus Poribacteria bacterium]